MKTLFGLLLALGLLPSASAITTINTTNKYAYGADIGWIDWRGDTNSGAVISEYVCSGYIYGANVGWIHLGSNAPANGIQYQNNSATDYGVNHDGFGNLRGFAYGANIGWINFESNGAPRVDLKSGKLSGYAYSANCGWISLSNAFAVVQTDAVLAGVDTDGDGLADAWERSNFGGLGADPGADSDGDGMSNKQEYLAGTNPTDSADKLAITSFSIASGGTTVNLTWDSVATRCYTIEKELDLSSSTWVDSGLGLITPDGATTSRMFSDVTAPMRYYRVRALRPLMP